MNLLENNNTLPEKEAARKVQYGGYETFHAEEEEEA